MNLFKFFVLYLLAILCTKDPVHLELFGPFTSEVLGWMYPTKTRHSTVECNADQATLSLDTFK